MVVPLVVLAVGSIFWGFLSRDMIIGLGSTTFNSSIYNNNFNYNIIDSEFLPSVIKNIPFFCTIFGIALSVLLINCWNVSKKSVFSAKMSFLYRNAYIFLSQKWHFDQITNEAIVVKFMNFGYRNTFQLIDKGNIEVFGPAGSAFNLINLSKQLSSVQSGFVPNYALVMTIALLSLFCFFILFSFVNNLGLLLLFSSTILYSYLIVCLLF
jgi:NADH-ubiquinone oxidoreductase chain 5